MAKIKRLTKEQKAGKDPSGWLTALDAAFLKFQQRERMRKRMSNRWYRWATRAASNIRQRDRLRDARPRKYKRIPKTWLEAASLALYRFNDKRRLHAAWENPWIRWADQTVSSLRAREYIRMAKIKEKESGAEIRQH